MELNEYAEKARRTDFNTDIHGNLWLYYALGLVGEAGEIAEKIKKAYRDNGGQMDQELMKKELGDVLWYLAMLSEKMGFTLEDVAQTNIIKLEDRMKRGVLNGSGDKR
jgi:NTP pyrophosphatase (non-canonical NTP hydrolase)